MERGSAERLVYVLLCLVLGGGALYLALRYLLPILLPFLIAWAASAAIMPAAAAISKRFRLSNRLCAVILLVLLLAALALGIGWSVSRLLGELGGLLSGLLSEYGSFEGAVNAALTYLESVLLQTGLFSSVGGELRERLYGMLGEILPSALSALASGVSSVAGGILRGLPTFLFAAIVTVIAGFYFCFDREGIERELGALLPRALRARLGRWRQGMRRLSLRYLRAYLLLLLLTFAVLLVGFLLLGVPYAFLLASVTAIVDFLPVLGIGTVLLPWAAFALLRGRYYLGLGLLILYGVSVLVRQIAEPRLVGKSLGMHPLLTVVATYAGWRLFGVIGMLLAPFAVVLLKGVLRREDA